MQKIRDGLTRDAAAPLLCPPLAETEAGADALDAWAADLDAVRDRTLLAHDWPDATLVVGEAAMAAREARALHLMIAAVAAAAGDPCPPFRRLAARAAWVHREAVGAYRRLLAPGVAERAAAACRRRRVGEIGAGARPPETP